MGESTDSKTEWGNSRKFWAETWRTIVLAILGAAATAKIINHYVEKDKVDLDTMVSLRAKAVDEFITASHKYTVAAAEFCSTGTNQTEFEGELIDSYRTSMIRVQAYYPKDTDIESQIKLIQSQSDSLHKTCGKRKDLTKSAWDTPRTDLISANNQLMKIAIERMTK